MNNEAKLGTIPTGNEGRDAVHVAIVPARAAEILLLGSPVRLNAENKAEACSPNEAIGIADPFRPHLTRKIAAGSWFWMCLYPKTITGLRHVWDHPAFPLAEASANPTEPETNLGVSKKWLKSYVKKHCPYWSEMDDGGYSEFLRYVKDERWIYYYGSDCHSLGDVEDANELFHHLSVVLGVRVDADYFAAFTCSC